MNIDFKKEYEKQKAFTYFNFTYYYSFLASYDNYTRKISYLAKCLFRHFIIIICLAFYQLF